MKGSRIARRGEPHWLYRLFDEEGRLLYVGQTLDPVSRFRVWVSRANCAAHIYGWFNDATRVTWHRYPDWFSAVTAEKRAIETERPLYNRDHQPTRVA